MAARSHRRNLLGSLSRVAVTALLIASCSTAGSDGEADPADSSNAAAAAEGGGNETGNASSDDGSAAPAKPGDDAEPGGAAPTTAKGRWTQPQMDGLDLKKNDIHNFGTHDIEASQGVIYVGTSYNGVWKSTDGAQTFVKVNTGVDGDKLDAGRLWTLAVDPTNSDVLYTTPGYGGGGLYKSVNGGVDWVQLLSPELVDATSEHIYSIELDPADSQHILATSHQPWVEYPRPSGLLESKDGGATWRIVEPGSDWGYGNYGMFIDSTTWLMHTQDNGLWRTTDSGDTWDQVTKANMTHGGTNLTRIGDVLYLGALGGILRSTDEGESWDFVGPQDSSAGVYDIESDGTYLWASWGFATQGEWGERYFMISPVDDGTEWERQPGGQTFFNGANGTAYDAVHEVLVASNWGAGVWRLDRDS
jgi:hypothetical protein